MREKSNLIIKLMGSYFKIHNNNIGKQRGMDQSRQKRNIQHCTKSKVSPIRMLIYQAL